MRFVTTQNHQTQWDAVLNSIDHSRLKEVSAQQLQIDFAG